MQITTEHIQNYDATQDAQAVFTLWQESVGQVWPLDFERMLKVLAGPEAHHLVVRINGELAGFAATFKSLRGTEKVGHLAAILVTPTLQGQGIGTALHDAALRHMREANLTTVQLGSIYPRFWCGVPTNLPQAVTFFQKRGWDYSHIVHDQVRDLSNYEIPQKIVERMAKEGIRIQPATSTTIDDVLQFEAREFQGWLRHFDMYSKLGDYSDLLVARDERDNRVVGTLVMYSPQSHPQRTDVIWQQILGESAGAMGAVGVSEEERGRGIGIALVAYASDILKQRGVENCYIDWIVITDFYAKLGYDIWRSYQTCWRTL